MSLLDFDNISKWYKAVNLWPIWAKVLISLFIIILVVFFIIIKYIDHRDTALQNALADYEKEILELRDRKNELLLKNSHLESLLEPIRQQATLAYPTLEITAALSKLIEDMKSVKAFSRQSQYSPPSESIKESIETRLQDLKKRHPNTRIVLQLEQGSANRNKVFDDIWSLLNATGFSPDKRFSINPFTDSQPPLVMKFHPSNKDISQELASIFSPTYLDEVWSGYESNQLDVELIELQIRGEPQFLDSGVVRFQK